MPKRGRLIASVWTRQSPAYSVVKSNYVIVDALAGMQGLWEYPHDRVEMGLILAGLDPIAVDTVVILLIPPYQEDVRKATEKRFS